MRQIGQILLAEDDLKDVELTLEALDTYNLKNEVVVVHDGVEALDYLYCRNQYAGRPHENPVLFLLDLKMPKMDGLDVLRVMQSDTNLKIIPTVLLTSSKMENDLIRGYQAGANAFVVKPVDFHEFVDVIKKVSVFWTIINEPPPAVLK